MIHYKPHILLAYVR